MIAAIGIACSLAAMTAVGYAYGSRMDRLHGRWPWPDGASVLQRGLSENRDSTDTSDVDALVSDLMAGRRSGGPS